MLDVCAVHRGCAVHWGMFSTLEDIIKYTVADIMSTLGVFGKVGDTMSTLGNIMSTVDIMSTPGMFSTPGFLFKFSCFPNYLPPHLS